MAATTTLRAMVEAMEAQIAAAPTIAVQIGDPLSGPSTLPSQRGALALYVRRESTTNSEDVRDQDVALVHDVIAIELQIRLGPKAQITSRGELYDIVDRVRNRLTNLTFRRQLNIRHLDTREAVQGEWFTVTMRLSTKRFETLGNE